MKILLVGNSQISCVKRAHDLKPDLFAAHEVYYYVVPGGEGPYLDVREKKLHLYPWGFNKDAPPRQHPDNTLDIPVDFYDAIIVCALGYIDGGFLYNNRIVKQGLLFGYGPRPNEFSDALVSTSCYRDIVFSMLEAQHGWKFLLRLREQYPGRILVQPYPLLSEAIIDHPDWVLNKMYTDSVGASEFFAMTRDDFLARRTGELGCELLARPKSALAGRCFTDARWMAAKDMLHPLDGYGRLVIDEMVAALG